jgi:hypothetical protein
MGRFYLDKDGRCMNCGGTEMTCWGDLECNDWHRFPTVESAEEKDDDAPTLAPELPTPNKKEKA